MKRVLAGLFFLFICINCSLSIPKKELTNPIFVFNNAFNKKDFPAISFSEQALLIKKLGFDGIEHRETKDILELKDVMEQHGLKIYADYMQIHIDREEPYLPEWKEIIPQLNGTGIILWVHIHSDEYKPSDEAADDKTVKILQDLADFSKPYGIKLAIYHHVNFLAETAEDSYRIAQKTNRENVGSVFNLCHFLRTDSEENLEKAIDHMIPKLFAVSISGADRGETQNIDWDQLIRPLGEGTFDVYRVVEILADKGYKGPIGIQCWELKGNPEVFLTKSSDTWKLFKQKYSLPINSLTLSEKKEGWELLFDGKSTRKWRGINQKKFPSKGWKVEHGEIISLSRDGAESAGGGDIITQKKYRNFMVKWEWKMVTKGGNSGLKYFVQEGIGSNKGYGYGLEYQILDDKYHPWMLSGKMKPNDYHTVGSLYEIYPASPTKRPSPLGLWNESMIVCKETHVEHWLNGDKILEYDRGQNDFKSRIANSKFKNVEGFGLWQEGHLLLQDHGSIVHFRNIKIKQLK